MPQIIRSQLNRLSFVSFLLLSTVGCDQATKAMARGNLSSRSVSYLGDLFRLQHTENPGAFLSLGADFQGDLRFWVFTVGVGVFTLGALYFLYRKNTDRAGEPAMTLWSSISFTLIVAGGLGNLIDRALKGTVTDFLNVGIGGLRTGIFNVADMAIMAGIAMMLFSVFKDTPSRTAQAKD